MCLCVCVEVAVKAYSVSSVPVGKTCVTHHASPANTSHVQREGGAGRRR